MGSIKTFFTSLPWYQKALVVVGLPLIVLLLLFKGTRELIISAVLSRARARTDRKDKELDSELESILKAGDREQGRIDQLELDREAAAEASKKDDPASFHNNRKRDSD